MRQIPRMFIIHFYGFNGEKQIFPRVTPQSLCDYIADPPFRVDKIIIERYEDPKAVGRN